MNKYTCIYVDTLSVGTQIKLRGAQRKQHPSIAVMVMMTMIVLL